MAPLWGNRSGWMSAPRLFLLNYGCSMGSGYATHTQTTAYRGVEEVAGTDTLRSVTRISVYDIFLL